jgi:hypothetical protein
MIKKYVILLLTISLFLVSLDGCKFFHRPDMHREVTEEEFGKKYSVDELKTDLDFLVRTIEDVHPDLYAYTSREDFTKERQRIEKELTSQLTRIEFYFLIAPLVSMLKDGHTKIYPVYEEYFHYIKEDGLVFPFDVEIRENATIIVENYTLDSIPYVGSELISINNIGTSEIVNELLPLTSGKRLEKRLEYISEFYRHFLWLKYPADSSFELRFISSEGEEIQKCSVQGVTYWDIQKKKREKGEQETNYSYKKLDNLPIGFLKIDLFPGNEESYDKFLVEVFSDLQEEEIDDLIIDIRDNGGGYSPAAIELLRYLTDKKIARIPRMDIKVSRQIKEYYRLSMPGFLRWFPMQWIHPTWRKMWSAQEGSIVTVSSRPEALKDTPLRFNGNVYVLIGAGTFSTATHFAAMVKDYQLGELVGSETGGLATSFGDFYPFDLPNTRLVVRVSHKRIFRPSGEDNGRGVLPDYSVESSKEDIAKGIDPVLQYAVELIEQ